MKYLLALLLVSFQLSANDEKVCEYLKSQTFQTYSKSASDWDDLDNKRLTTALREVSIKLEKIRDTQCKEGKHFAIYDYDNCSTLCIESTTSDRRAKAASHGLVLLGKDTKRCQQLCKSYQLSAYAFRDGLKTGAESGNCDGAVNTTNRNSAKVISTPNADERINGKNNISK